jgi:hypothetical protein
MPTMRAAVAALSDFETNMSLLEPQGWNRSNHGAVHRRRPDLSPTSEFVAP